MGFGNGPELNTCKQGWSLQEWYISVLDGKQRLPLPTLHHSGSSLGPLGLKFLGPPHNPATKGAVSYPGPGEEITQ